MRVKLAGDLDISRIVHGHWRLLDWKMSNEQLLDFTKQLIDIGITTFDHADIYGNYECEKRFGEALTLEKSIRNKIQIITKCGIKLKSDKFPDRKLKTYDYSYQHIKWSVENSLKNFHTDYIDLLLLHRPAPFFDPEEIARAFQDLKKEGKVLHFGVSNFTPLQFEMLNRSTDEKPVTNQVEISPYCLEHFENGNIDFFVKEKIKPIAWSPIGGGKIHKPVDQKGTRLNAVLQSIANELKIENIDKVIYAWLLNHPAQIVPIVGSGKLERVKYAIDALEINLSTEQWYQIYNASTGVELP